MIIALASKLSKLAGRTRELPEASPETISNAVETLRAGKDVEGAKASLEAVSGLMSSSAPNEALYISYGLATERTRPSFALTQFWEDLFDLFPGNSTALRLTMRWYRRDRMVQAGLARLNDWLPEANSDVAQAKLALAGLAELNATETIKLIVSDCLVAHPDADDLRMAFIRQLAKQAQYMLAQRHAEALVGARKLMDRDSALLAEIREKAALQAEFCATDDTDIVAMAIETISRLVPVEPNTSRSCRVSYFTGTLGQGGAELQMSRIATALHKADVSKLRSGTMFDDFESDVVVRSAAPNTKDGFFLSALQSAGIPVRSLVDTEVPSIRDFAEHNETLGKLLSLMPNVIAETTLKLACHYRRVSPTIAYLWQDGAVLDGCIAALLAGVPAIVTSFRGLPPNLRPELNRPHMEEAFRALSRLPNVQFTANSQTVATAYEDWLGLEKNSVQVIFNAAPILSSTETEEDEALWRGIVESSSDCKQTVLGIFRHDQNKRPQMWIEIAEIALRRSPLVRFVILGDGSDFEKSHNIVMRKGLEKRIFMPGVRRNVGFYLARSDMLMHVSLMEGLPNALLEAHTAGLPVLTTPAGGAEEIVCNGESGYVLEGPKTLSPADAADVLCNMLSDPVRLRTMGECGRKRVAKPFAISLVLERTIQVFSGAAEARPRPDQTTILSSPAAVP